MELDELVHELIPISPSVELKEDEGPKLITIPPSVELKEDEGRWAHMLKIEFEVYTL